MHVARFVLDHVPQELLEERLLRLLVHEPNAPSARPSTMICMPRNFMSQRRRHDGVEDAEVVVDLVEPELRIEVAVEHLDVAPLVHDLRRAVELAVEELHGLGDLGRARARPARRGGTG